MSICESICLLRINSTPSSLPSHIIHILNRHEHKSRFEWPWPTQGQGHY